MNTQKIHLTPREIQILSILRTTAPSNKVITRQLNITESTVKLHVGNMLKKFGVHSRTQLIVFTKEHKI